MLPNADSCLRRLLRDVVEKLLVSTKFAKREETGKRKLLEGGSVLSISAMAGLRDVRRQSLIRQ